LRKQDEIVKKMMNELKYKDKILDMYENPDIEDVAGFFTDSLLVEKR
jgi:hypothetical protein